MNGEPNRELNRDIHLRELTKAVWRVTERMSDDVLKTRVRVLAEEIFELAAPQPFALRRTQGIQAQGQVLLSLLKLSEELGQVNSLNSSVLLREYDKLFHEIEQVVPSGEKIVKREKVLMQRSRLDRDRGEARPLGGRRRIMAQRKMAQRPSVTERHRERQREVIQFLKNRGEARLRDFSSLFPNISQRMVRRILAQLVRMGNIRREGKGQGSHYRL